MAYKQIICAHCKEGPDHGPLIKISNFDYAHRSCFETMGQPKIGNVSFKWVPDMNDVKLARKKIAEDLAKKEREAYVEKAKENK